MRAGSRWAVALAGSVLVAVVTGCSGSGSSSPATGSGGAVAASTDAAPLDPNNYVLATTDAPAGFDASPPTPDPSPSSEDDADKSFDKCVGGSANPLATANGAQFLDSTDGTAISSTAETYPAATVASDIKALKDPAFMKKGLSCIRTYLAQESDPSSGDPSIQSVDPYGVSTLPDAVLGLRVYMTAESGGEDIPVYMDLIAFARGRAEPTLVVVQREAPPDSGLESQLAGEISQRLAHQ